MDNRDFKPVRRIRGAGIIILILLLTGTIGYVLLEGYTLLEGLYMTVITLSTVGFGEIKTLSSAGQIFTVFLILSGVGTLAFSASQAAQIILDEKVFKRRRREAQAAKMKNHVIICGFGRIGLRVAERLKARKEPFVIVEQDQSVFDQMEASKFLFVEGDAREDATLQKAGIMQAKSIVATLPSDADNVYIILSARTLNPDLHIVTRAAQPESMNKLQQAGANKVISPYEIGSRYITNAIIRPNVVDFMEDVASQTGRSADLDIEQIPIPDNSPFAGKALRETDIRSARNIIVLSIRDRDEGTSYNPSPDHIIEEGGTLICIGFIEQLDRLLRDVQPKSRRTSDN